MLRELGEEPDPNIKIIEHNAETQGVTTNTAKAREKPT